MRPSPRRRGGESWTSHERAAGGGDPCRAAGAPERAQDGARGADRGADRPAHAAGPRARWPGARGLRGIHAAAPLLAPPDRGGER